MMVHTFELVNRIQRLYLSSLRAGVAAMLVLTLAGPSPLVAQLRTTKPEKGPRAIAVVRWQTDAQGKSVPRLLPVVILDGGKYYDAGLYRATPRPMALEPGVVYEAQDQGERLGYFTVKHAARSEGSRQWFGTGEWESSRDANTLELKDRTQTAEVVKESKPGTDRIFTESVDDRDIKKKSTIYDEEGREIPEGQAPPPDDKEAASGKRKQGDIDRLPQIAPPKKEAPKPTSAEDDPDRPRLKRGTPTPETPGNNATTSAEVTAAPKAAARADDDPNRPILRRGGQQKQDKKEESSLGTPVPGRIQARGDVPSGATRQESGLATRTFEAVAVSDASDTEMRQDYRFRWTESEREELTAKMRQLAADEVAKFLQRTATTKAQGANARRTAAKPSFELTDRRMAGLDLDFNNSAELVYSGTAEADGRAIFATVVARVDLEGNPRKLFADVTASDRLDVAPRLELVDAVDANGNGRADLLFRRIRARTSEFVLYQVGPDTLTELFHGGNAE